MATFSAGYVFAMALKRMERQQLGIESRKTFKLVFKYSFYYNVKRDAMLVYGNREKHQFIQFNILQRCRIMLRE
ncbi:Hypothetical predicted protein, partial [Paramuricea clavata]